MVWMVWRGAGSHISHWQLFALQVNMAINIAYQGDAGGPVEDQRPLRSRDRPDRPVQHRPPGRGGEGGAEGRAELLRPGQADCPLHPSL